jgi:hypothetical protein
VIACWTVWLTGHGSDRIWLTQTCIAPVRVSR